MTSLREHPLILIFLITIITIVIIIIDHHHNDHHSDHDNRHQYNHQRVTGATVASLAPGEWWMGSTGDVSIYSQK